MMKNKVTAVILVGGKGTRLRTIISDKPKVLAEVNGRPFLTYLLDQLDRINIEEVVFCCGYMAESIEAYFGYKYKTISIKYSKEKTTLDTGGALRLAFPMFSSETILVMNGDSYVETDLTVFVNSFINEDQIAKMLLVSVQDVSRFGRVCVDNESLVTTFDEKGKYTGEGWVNAGIYLLKRKVILDIPKDCLYSLEKSFFPELIGKGLLGFCSEDNFIDIGTPESYKKADHFFKKY